MAMTMDAPQGAISIGRVVNETYRALQRNAAVIWPLAVILVVIPQFLVNLIQARAVVGGTMSVDQGAVLLTGILALFAGLSGMAFQIAAIYCVVEDMHGRRATIGGALSATASRYLAVFAIGILSGIGIAIGFVALVVPGMMLAIRWIVAVPVRVAERPGISAALGRSAVLTKGSRWTIFGLVLVFWLAILVASMVIGGVLVGLMWLGHVPFSQRWPLGLVTSVEAAVMYAAIACGVAVIYSELRRVREGGDAVQTAAVFA
jgi:uncharacterized membrane protein